MGDGGEEEAVLILWKDGININDMRNDRIVKHSWRIEDRDKGLIIEHWNDRKNGGINIIVCRIGLLSDSGIR